ASVGSGASAAGSWFRPSAVGAGSTRRTLGVGPRRASSSARLLKIGGILPPVHHSSASPDGGACRGRLWPAACSVAVGTLRIPLERCRAGHESTTSRRMNLPRPRPRQRWRLARRWAPCYAENCHGTVAAIRPRCHTDRWWPRALSPRRGIVEYPRSSSAESPGLVSPHPRVAGPAEGGGSRGGRPGDAADLFHRA